jgi:hypothetical protein
MHVKWGGDGVLTAPTLKCAMQRRLAGTVEPYRECM